MEPTFSELFFDYRTLNIRELQLNLRSSGFYNPLKLTMHLENAAQYGFTTHSQVLILTVLTVLIHCLFIYRYFALFLSVRYILLLFILFFVPGVVMIIAYGLISRELYRGIQFEMEQKKDSSGMNLFFFFS